MESSVKSSSWGIRYRCLNCLVEWSVLNSTEAETVYCGRCGSTKLEYHQYTIQTGVGKRDE